MDLYNNYFKKFDTSDDLFFISCCSTHTSDMQNFKQKATEMFNAFFNACIENKV